MGDRLFVHSDYGMFNQMPGNMPRALRRGLLRQTDEIGGSLGCAMVLPLTRTRRLGAAVGGAMDGEQVGNRTRGERSATELPGYNRALRDPSGERQGPLPPWQRQSSNDRRCPCDLPAGPVGGPQCAGQRR